jgi:hypothetical protein
MGHGSPPVAARLDLQDERPKLAPRLVLFAGGGQAPRVAIQRSICRRAGITPRLVPARRRCSISPGSSSASCNSVLTPNAS